MSDNFPIDIDYKKVTEWLYERKKLPKDWAAKHKAITLKISDILKNNTVQDKSTKDFMKKNEENASYYILNAVVERILKTEEAQSKNFLGRYNSKNVSDLIALKTLFEKDNIHIADMAKMMNQNATFEIAAIRKNITSFENQLQDLSQQEETYKNSITTSEKEFSFYCDKLGIPGEDIYKEVPALIKHLPEIFNDFVKLAQDPIFRELLDYYYQFTIYINQKQDEEKLKLKYLEHLNKEGDDLAELVELKTSGGIIPESLIKENERKYSKYQEKKDQADKVYTIDWNISIESSSQPTTTATNNTGGGAIDWSEFEVVGGSQTPKDHKQDEFEIITEEKSVPAEIVEKDTILSNFETRNQILANLNELLFFFKQRIMENEALSGNTILQAYDQGSSHLFEVSTNRLKEMLVHIEKMIDKLTNFKTRQYLILKEQPKASERIISHLNQFKLNATRARENLSGLSKKTFDIGTAINENKQELNDLIKETSEIKGMIENHMKNLIKRDVHIIGEINKILKS